GDDTHELDRDLVRQHDVADRGAGMPSGFTEHFDKEIRAAVNDSRRIIEIRHRVDHAKQFDDEVDAVERTKCVAHGSKKSKSDEASAPVAFIDADLSAEFAGQRFSHRAGLGLRGTKGFLPVDRVDNWRPASAASAAPSQAPSIAHQHSWASAGTGTILALRWYISIETAWSRRRK